MSQPSPDGLRRLLRAGDPLPPGETLSPETVQRMRRAVLAGAPRPAWTVWRIATATAALGAAAGIALLIRQGDPDVERLAGAPPPIAVAAAPQASDRQIHLTTRGGTRVIWMLKPRGE